MKRAGGVSEGDIARRKVVDVPSESTASPGVDSATIVAGLSPVKEATRQSETRSLTFREVGRLGIPFTWIETPSANPPTCHLAEGCTAKHGLRTYFFSQLRTSTSTEKGFVPSTGRDVHQVHAARIQNVDRSNGAEEK